MGCKKLRIREIGMRRLEHDERSSVDTIKTGRGLSVW